MEQIYIYERKIILIEGCYRRCNIQRKGQLEVVLVPRTGMGKLFGNNQALSSPGTLPERLVLLPLLL